MAIKASRRTFLIFLFLTGCSFGKKSIKAEEFIVGTMSYGDGERTLNQYDRFIQHLEEKAEAFVQLEPAYNEAKALERIRSQAWSLVFAPPGLAAIAISQHQYVPLFPLQGTTNLRSVIVVMKDSPYQDLRSLTGKVMALGQPGSATGYYFPIYNLYGLTLAGLLVSPTPKAILTAIAEGKVDAGALSMEQFTTYKNQIGQTEFRILFTDPHQVPAGSVLISPTIERNRQEWVRTILRDTPSIIADEAGFIPNGNVPDYQYMIAVVKRVRDIFPGDQSNQSALLAQRPVRLFKGGLSPLPSDSPSSTAQ